MVKAIKKKFTLEKYTRKHVFISFFGFIQSLTFVAFIVELLLFKTFGYSPVTQYYPLSNKPLSLHFWQKCGTYRPSDEFPFPNLFCANDTNTYINPFLRAVLFGIETYAVVGGFLIGIILLVVGIMAIKNRGKKVPWIGASAIKKVKNMSLLFILLVAVLIVIYRFV